MLQKAHGVSLATMFRNLAESETQTLRLQFAKILPLQIALLGCL